MYLIPCSPGGRQTRGGTRGGTTGETETATGGMIGTGGTTGGKITLAGRTATGETTETEMLRRGCGSTAQSAQLTGTAGTTGTGETTETGGMTGTGETTATEETTGGETEEMIEGGPPRVRLGHLEGKTGSRIIN